MWPVGFAANINTRHHHAACAPEPGPQLPRLRGRRFAIDAHALHSTGRCGGRPRHSASWSSELQVSRQPRACGTGATSSPGRPHIPKAPSSTQHQGHRRAAIIDGGLRIQKSNKLRHPVNGARLPVLGAGGGGPPFCCNCSKQRGGARRPAGDGGLHSLNWLHPRRPARAPFHDWGLTP